MTMANAINLYESVSPEFPDQVNQVARDRINRIFDTRKCGSMKTKINKRHKRLEVNIPFAGFYESIHSHEMDNVLAQMTTDDRGDQITFEAPEFRAFDEAGQESYADYLEARRKYEMLEAEDETPGDNMWQHIDWRKAQENYAKFYAENFAAYFHQETGIDLEATWSEMISPREYNFATDRLFINVRVKAVKEMFEKVDLNILRQRIKDKFTSYDGFSSYYSNDLDVWLDPRGGNGWGKPSGRVTNWDTNMLGTLLEAVMLTCGLDIKEFEWAIFEDSNGNGEIDGILVDAMDEAGHAILDRIYQYRNPQENDCQISLPLEAAHDAGISQSA